MPDIDVTFQVATMRISKAAKDCLETCQRQRNKLDSSVCLYCENSRHLLTKNVMTGTLVA
jgi:hypothetical protein